MQPSVDPITVYWITAGDIAAAVAVGILVIGMAFTAGLWVLWPDRQQRPSPPVDPGEDETVELPRPDDYDLAGGR